MNRIGDLLKTLIELLHDLGLDLPPWTLPALVGVLALLMAPGYLRGIRITRARKLLQRAGIEHGEAREALEAEALAQVAGHKPGLLAVAEEALRRGRPPVAEAAVAQLAALGAKKEVLALRRQLRPPPAPTAFDAAHAVERLREAGLHEEASRRLAAARALWPRDPTLAAMEQTLPSTSEDRGEIHANGG